MPEALQAAGRAEQAFADDTRIATVRGVRVAAGIGAVFIPLFNVLDWLTAPEHARDFLHIRLAVAVMHGLCLLATFHEEGRKRIVAIGYVACFAATGSITAMQHILEPGSSTYVAGLNLCLLAIAVLFAWRPGHTFVVNGLVVGGFLASAAFGWPVADLGLFFNNFFFLGATALISAVSSWAAHREHRRRFDLSWSLETRSRDLVLANERLRQVDELKSRFFANVSHELRTPLTLALSPLESLLQARLPAEVKSQLHGLYVDLQVLRRRIEDLIELARLDSGRATVNRAPQDLSRVVRTVLHAARPFALRHRIVIDERLERELPAVPGDASMLEQIAFNLVSNALKFTPAGGSVVVELRREGEGVTLSVRDSGPGLSEEDQRDLFVRFGKSATTSVAKGSGLGLSLVKEFAELHGGSVSVASRPGEGAAFTVVLPLGPAAVGELPEKPIAAHLAMDFESELAEREAEEAEETVRPDDRRPLVLVADDNARLRKLVRIALESDFRVMEAADGVEALERVEAHDPTVVVSDMMMPRLDGAEFLAAVRTRPRWRHLPVLLLTAHADAGLRDECLELGASDFLAKPFSVRELRARVRNFAALRSAQLSLGATNDALAQALETTRSAQTRAIRAEKLAAIGQLSVGIAHEVKNPVNFLLNYARPSRARVDRLRAEAMDIPGGERFAMELGVLGDAMTRIVEGGDRIVGIVNGLQAFARGGDARLPVDVDAEVRAVHRLAERSVPAGVTLHVDPRGAGEIVGSPVSVGAVVMNLLANAFRAVGQGGNVWIETEDGGDHAVVVVRDDGCGMTEEIQAHIFDPFFTTRPSGEGLGLGLALVHRIVHEDLGGSIEVVSAPGAGTTFRLRFPRSVAAVTTPWSDLAAAEAR